MPKLLKNYSGFVFVDIFTVGVAICIYVNTHVDFYSSHLSCLYFIIKEGILIKEHAFSMFSTQTNSKEKANIVIHKSWNKPELQHTLSAPWPRARFLSIYTVLCSISPYLFDNSQSDYTR